MEEPFERLQKARRDAGYKEATEAARAFGWNENTYRSHENGERGLRPDRARRYAQAFQVKAEWLLYGGSGRQQTTETVSVRVVGKVAAGVWLDVDNYSFSDETWVPAVRSPEYRNGEQVAYKVEGPSMNKVLPDGVYAIGVLYGMARSPRHNDIVVVRRTRAGLVETTIKRYMRINGKEVLMPESDDPRYQQPLLLDAPEDDATVELHALIIGSYRPV